MMIMIKSIIGDVLDDSYDAGVKFRPDDDESTTVTACSYQVAVLRDQTPPNKELSGQDVKRDENTVN